MTTAQNYSSQARRFVLHRLEDVSGVSGTGIVADGVYFLETGASVIAWRSEFKSVAVYQYWNAVIGVHCHGGKTKVVWIDERPSGIPASCEEV